MKRRNTRKKITTARIGLDPRLRNLSASIANVRDRVAEFALVATPDMTLRDIIAHCGTLSTSGHLDVFFTDGTWTFKDGVSISRPRVNFWSLGNNTVFERHKSATGTRPLLELRAEEITLNGIRFNDTGTNLGPAVKVTEDRCVVRNCTIEDSWRAIEVNGADGVRVLDNHVLASRDTDYSIYVTGSSVDGIMVGNIVEQAGLTANIFFDTGSARWVIANNQTLSGKIRFTDTDGHATTSNSGSSISVVADENSVVSAMVFS